MSSLGLDLLTRDTDKAIFTPRLLFFSDSHVCFSSLHVSVQSYVCGLFSHGTLQVPWTGTQGRLTSRATKKYTANVLVFSARGSLSWPLAPS